MKYVKPDFNVTEFQVDERVAGCEKTVIGTETTKVYKKQTVDCLIGGQEETVFNSASECYTSASQWGVTEYNGKTYFVWFTYAGDTAGGQPSASATATLNKLVTQLGFTAGPGWHYCDVTGTDIVTDVLGFSY